MILGSLGCEERICTGKIQGVYIKITSSIQSSEYGDRTAITWRIQSWRPPIHRRLFHFHRQLVQCWTPRAEKLRRSTQLIAPSAFRGYQTQEIRKRAVYKIRKITQKFKRLPNAPAIAKCCSARIADCRVLLSVRTQVSFWSEFRRLWIHLRIIQNSPRLSQWAKVCIFQRNKQWYHEFAKNSAFFGMAYPRYTSSFSSRWAIARGTIWFHR